MSPRKNSAELELLNSLTESFIWAFIRRMTHVRL